jgi:hypothetical protein
VVSDGWVWGMVFYVCLNLPLHHEEVSSECSQEASRSKSCDEKNFPIYGNIVVGAHQKKGNIILIVLNSTRYFCCFFFTTGIKYKI